MFTTLDLLAGTGGLSEQEVNKVEIGSAVAKLVGVPKIA